VEILFFVFFSNNYCGNHPELYSDLKSLYTGLSYPAKFLLLLGNYLSDVCQFSNVKSSICESDMKIKYNYV